MNDRSSALAADQFTKASHSWALLLTDRTAQAIVNLCILLVGAVTFCFALIQLKPILVPFIFAVLLAGIVRPLVDRSADACSNSSNAADIRSTALGLPKERTPLTMSNSPQYRCTRGCERLPRLLAVLATLVLIMALIICTAILFVNSVTNFQEHHFQEYKEELFERLGVFELWLRSMFEVDELFMDDVEAMYKEIQDEGESGGRS